MNDNGIISGVIVPLSQSLITGGFIGLTVNNVGLVAGWANPHYLGLLAGSVVSSFTWLILRNNWEARVRHDIGMVDPVTPAVAYPQTVKVDFISEDKKQGEYLQFSIPYDKLYEFAVGISQKGKGLSNRDWVGNGMLFRGNEFSEFRNELILRGFAKWNNDGDRRQGSTLTKKGMALCKGISNHCPTTQ